MTSSAKRSRSPPRRRGSSDFAGARDGGSLRHRLGALFAPVMLYVTAGATLFDPAVRATLVAAFGARPFGVPVVGLVAVVQSVVLLPLAWALVHAYHLARQWTADGGGIGAWSFLHAQRAFGARHPHLRRSQQVSAFGLLYFMILCAAWITYAHHRGI